MAQRQRGEGFLCFSDMVSEKNPSAKVNEDRAYVGKRMAWVIDGATPLGVKNYTKTASDTEWIAERLNREFLKADQGGERWPATVLENAAVKIRQEFFRVSGLNELPPPAMMPSSQVAMLMWEEDERKLRYLMLGDSRIAISTPKITVELADNRLQRFDAEAIAEMYKLQKTLGISHLEARKKIDSIVIDNRALMNRKDTYWMFVPDKKAVEHVRIGNIDVEEKMKVIISSDGFYGAIGNMPGIESWEAMFKELERTDLKGMLARIRRYEESDSECREFPRFKKHDDASAVLLEFQ
ncbi:MAG: hypothetical protein KGH61_02000 [Candidatus Micrarchaeota archaeon]|nr:hypothetical protein [Candidatus Micrarchaeota archaeon]MDE1847703.1 hypothetical protein [Candidatus Micrarchaeota archaeon]MDE1864132.1 hypothetical protein [Candidatus Micrarchaeota archaeon]